MVGRGLWVLRAPFFFFLKYFRSHMNALFWALYFNSGIVFVSTFLILWISWWRVNWTQSTHFREELSEETPDYLGSDKLKFKNRLHEKFNCLTLHTCLPPPPVFNRHVNMVSAFCFYEHFYGLNWQDYQLPFHIVMLRNILIFTFTSHIDT